MTYGFTDRTNCYSWDFANGQFNNISKCFLNNSIFELGRVPHHCGARNYYSLSIEIFLHMPITQFLCSKCIHLWDHLTSKMTSNMNNLPYTTISTRRPWSSKKRQFAWAGLGETLTFSLWKKDHRGEADSSQAQLLLAQISSMFLSQAWVENKWDIVVVPAEKQFSKFLHSVRILLARTVACAVMC